MHTATEAAVRLRQADLRGAADRERCCGRGDLVRAARRRRLRRIIGR